MKRSGICHTCGARIRPRAKDMSLGAAVRKHYWRHHPERMMRHRIEAAWDEEATKPVRAPKTARRR